MAKADGLLPKFLHFQTKIKYTEDQNIEVWLENITDHDWANVVRCRDCINWNGNDCITIYGLCRPRPDDYCSRGRMLMEDETYN